MAEMPETNAPPVPIRNIYFNGFQLGLSNADMGAVLMLQNVPIATISMSYTTAKTLSEALTEMIATLERVTEREIMTTHQVGKGLETLASAEKPDGNVH